jgi:hypothetical protein
MSEPLVLPITETTQAHQAGVDIGVGSIWDRDLPGPDGSVEARMSARLFLYDESSGREWDVTAIVGTKLQLPDGLWRVTAIDEGTDDRRGYVVLERPAC